MLFYASSLCYMLEYALATSILLSLSITWKDGKGGCEMAGGGETIAWAGG